METAISGTQIAALGMEVETDVRHTSHPFLNFHLWSIGVEEVCKPLVCASNGVQRGLSYAWP